MLCEDTRLELAEDVTFQSVGGDQTVILSLASGYLYTCNETTAGFLSAIDGTRSFGQIVDRLWGEYDVPREKLSADLAELAGRLVEEKLLVIRAEGGQADA